MTDGARPSAKGPDFIILGEMRCSTSSLYAAIGTSPLACLVPEKEVHFFSDELTYSNGLEWYEGLFPPKVPGGISGEASPSYLNTKIAAPRIRRHYPDAKLVICLRDPGSRALSQYFHQCKYGLETREPEEVFGDTDKYVLNNYVECSLYAPSILWYLNFFPPSQIALFIFESYVRQPMETLQSIFNFIGLPTDDIQPFHLLSATPPNIDAGIKKLMNNVSYYAQEVTECLPQIVAKHNLHVAGNLDHLRVELLTR